MGIIEFIALIAVFVLCIVYMVVVTISQYRLAGRLDELSAEKKAMRDELTSLRERLKKVEVNSNGREGD